MRHNCIYIAAAPRPGRVVTPDCDVLSQTVSIVHMTCSCTVMPQENTRAMFGTAVLKKDHLFGISDAFAICYN